MNISVEHLKEAPFMEFADGQVFTLDPPPADLEQAALEIRRALCDQCPLPHRGEPPFPGAEVMISPGEINGAVNMGRQCTGPIVSRRVERGKRVFAVAPRFFFTPSHPRACAHIMKEGEAVEVVIE